MDSFAGLFMSSSLLLLPSTVRPHQMDTALLAGTVNTPRGTVYRLQSEHSPAGRDGEHPKGPAKVCTALRAGTVDTQAAVRLLLIFSILQEETSTTTSTSTMIEMVMRLMINDHNDSNNMQVDVGKR